MLVENRRRSHTHLDDLSRLTVLRLAFSLAIIVQVVIFLEFGGADAVVFGHLGCFLIGLSPLSVFTLAFQFLRCRVVHGQIPHERV